jgi:hypothetical protein
MLLLRLINENCACKYDSFFLFFLFLLSFFISSLLSFFLSFFLSFEKELRGYVVDTLDDFNQGRMDDSSSKARNAVIEILKLLMKQLDLFTEVRGQRRKKCRSMH